MAGLDWRLFIMLVFICVIVIVAFSDIISHQSPIPPTELPPLTLVLRTITESPPINGALPIVLTLVDNSPDMPTHQPQSPTSNLILDITPPNCYEMPHDGIQCLGFIQNPYDETLENINLAITLWNRDGQFIERIAFTIPQTHIPPYSLAPYQVIFSRDDLQPADFGAVQMEFIHAQLAPFKPLQIMFDEKQVDITDTLYQLSGTIHHRLGGVRALRMVVSVIDDEQQLMGFRVVLLEAVESGREYPLRVDLMPLFMDSIAGHLVYIETVEHDGLPENLP